MFLCYQVFVRKIKKKKENKKEIYSFITTVQTLIPVVFRTWALRATKYYSHALCLLLEFFQFVKMHYIYMAYGSKLKDYPI